MTSVFGISIALYCSIVQLLSTINVICSVHIRSS